MNEGRMARSESTSEFYPNLGAGTHLLTSHKKALLCFILLRSTSKTNLQLFRVSKGLSGFKLDSARQEILLMSRQTRSRRTKLITQGFVHFGKFPIAIITILDT